MITTNVKEARQNFSHLLHEVEHGEEVLILRRGHIVAHIIPHKEKKTHKRLPSLNEFRRTLKVKGKALSELIIKERAEEHK